MVGSLREAGAVVQGTTTKWGKAWKLLSSLVEVSSTHARSTFEFYPNFLQCLSFKSSNHLHRSMWIKVTYHNPKCIGTFHYTNKSMGIRMCLTMHRLTGNKDQFAHHYRVRAFSLQSWTGGCRHNGSSLLVTTRITVWYAAAKLVLGWLVTTACDLL